MLTVHEVAKRLNVSESTVYALVESGRLVPHRIGLGRGAIRVSEEDLAAYLESCRNEKTETRKVPRPRLKHIKLS